MDIEEKDIPDSIKIVIYCQTDRIDLLIRDNGQGFDASRKLSMAGSKGGIGLSSMRERAELSGGSFAVESAFGKGTSIQVTWPLA